MSDFLATIFGIPFRPKKPAPSAERIKYEIAYPAPAVSVDEFWWRLFTDRQLTLDMAGEETQWVSQEEFWYGRRGRICPRGQSALIEKGPTQLDSPPP